MSWHPEPGAEAVNAFSINWSNLKCYAFPPFSLLPPSFEGTFSRQSVGVTHRAGVDDSKLVPTPSAARRQTDFTNAER